MTAYPAATLSDLANRLLALRCDDAAALLEAVPLSLGCEPPVLAALSALVDAIEQRDRDHAAEVAELRAEIARARC